MVTIKMLNGRLQGRVNYMLHLELPVLKNQKWYFVDSLPEVQPGYNLMIISGYCAIILTPITHVISPHLPRLLERLRV
jgi:hypothetical protein